MAEKRLKALVRRYGPQPEVHLSVWGGIVGRTGQIWIEDDGRGVWLVQVLRSPVHEQGEPEGTLLRPADESDHKRFRECESEVPGLISQAQSRASAQGLPMRFVSGELDLKRRFLRLYFTAPGRVDFRDLLRDLSKELKLRIEFRQVGPRDAARLLGGLGPCGRPLCCRSFLRQLRPIPLELAFDQQLFFSPERITGCCGRLMCCLAYEHAQYLEALRGLPKVGEKIVLEGRKGRVVGINIFRNTLTLAWEDGSRGEVQWEKLNSNSEPEAPPPEPSE